MQQTTINPSDGDISLSIGKPHNLNVTLNPEVNEMLTRLATAETLSKSTIIRQLITYRYTMRLQHVPLCATGSRCFCPERHPPPQPAPHQTLVPEQKPI